MGTGRVQFYKKSVITSRQLRLQGRGRREIGGGGESGDDGLAGVIDGDASAHVHIGASEVSRIEQLRPVWVQLDHKGVVIAAAEIRLYRVGHRQSVAFPGEVGIP